MVANTIKQINRRILKLTTVGSTILMQITCTRGTCENRNKNYGTPNLSCTVLKLLVLMAVLLVSFLLGDVLVVAIGRVNGVNVVL